MNINLPQPLFSQEGRRAEGAQWKLPQPLFFKEGRTARCKQVTVSTCAHAALGLPPTRDARRTSPFGKGGSRGIRFPEMRA